MRERIIFSLVLFAFLVTGVSGYAEVIINDGIAVKGEPLMLEAKIKGGFFPKGGEVVEFFADNRSLGRNLSGGDGIAFKEFIPLKKGLYKVRAEAGEDKGRGLLLSLDKGDGIVFIDVVGSLLDKLLSMEPKEGSQESLKRISDRFPVVYLQTVIPEGFLRPWLEKNGFINAPLLSWGEGLIFNEIIEKGLKIKAVIAGASVVESTGKYKPEAYSFDDLEGAVEVKDWEEIERKLQ